MKFEISAPATLSNFGPGFDSLGMAIDRYLKVTFETADSSSKSLIEISGEFGAPHGDENIVYKRIKEFYKKPFKLFMHNDIPLKRGLGSSSAALASALALEKLISLDEAGLIGNETDNASLTELIRPKIYNEAIKAEGHPDNITPCLFGGFVTARVERGEGAFINIPFPEYIDLHILVPELETETRTARKILPESYCLSDIVTNLQNLSFMVAEFCMNSKSPENMPIFSNLKQLFKDRIHELYRLKLCPPCLDAIQSLNSSEKIFGAFLSGSGTCVCAMAYGDVKTEINNALHIFTAQNQQARHYVHKIEYSGLKIRRGEK